MSDTFEAAGHRQNLGSRSTMVDTESINSSTLCVSTDTKDLHQSELEIPNLYIDCPYQIGNVLTLSCTDCIVHARIKDVYRGGDGAQFSNSCTLLLDIQKQDENLGLCYDMVLKVIDWRFVHDPRENLEMDDWNHKCLDAYTSISIADRTSFQNWLSQPCSDIELKNPLIQTYQRYAFLPQKPTHADLYYFALENGGRHIKNFFNEKLIPNQASVGYREIFLEFWSSLQLAAEEKIAAIVNANLPERMPLTRGVWNICSVSTSQKFHVEQWYNHSALFKVSGLLMERIIGLPIKQLVSEGIDKGVLRELLIDLSTFHLQVVRCNLQIMDRNIHNFFFFKDEFGGISIRMVDFGGIEIVNADPWDIAPIMARPAYTSTPQQLLYSRYSKVFDFSKELECLLGFVNLFPHLRNEIEGFARHLLTHYADPDTKDIVERFRWQTIMLHAIHAFPQSMFVSFGPLILYRILQVRDILAEEFGKKADNWTIRATSRVCKLLKIDDSQAQTNLCHLQNFGESWLKATPNAGSNCLGLAHRLLNEAKLCHGVGSTASCLVFGQFRHEPYTDCLSLQDIPQDHWNQIPGPLGDVDVLMVLAKTESISSV